MFIHEPRTTHDHSVLEKANQDLAKANKACV